MRLALALPLVRVCRKTPDLDGDGYASDDDCDGVADNDVVDAPAWYSDDDEDGLCSANVVATACVAPPGSVDNADDCNDRDGRVHPGATERCDGADNGCNGTTDDNATDAATWYRDLDGDAHGDATSVVVACVQPPGYTALADDCDDLNRKAHPGAAEVCDGVDNDCTEDVNDGVLSTFYADTDSDGYGDATSTAQACNAPSGYVANRTDCDDTALAVHPGQFELCNGVDDNCDTNIDENAVDKSTYYADADADGHGTPLVTKRACSTPSGYADVSDDCNDSRPDIYGGAPERCDGVDHDCDDADALIFPSATEICNGLDDDCDGAADSGLAGAEAACAAASCDAILTALPGTPSDTYFLSGAAPYQTYCEMTLNGGGWTLAAKLTNQDAPHWVTAKADWTSANAYGSTTTLAPGADAKSEAWSQVPATELMLTDDQGTTTYVATNASCLGGASASTFFTTALATNYLVIARTDAHADTSGVISFYNTSYDEADVGLGALENGAEFSTSPNQQDIGGPTSCGYSNATCATQYPETVYFWVK